MNFFELFGTIAINNEQANKALADTGKQASGLSKTMESAFGKMQSTAMKIGAAVASAFAIGKIKDFGQQCSEVYASVAAEQAAFSQIMGDYAVMATEKMNAVADSTGMVATRLTPYMTSMTAKFKGLGYGVDEATSLAQEGLMIAADASAFWDKSLDESMSHLNSFINGSYEGGEAIGLFANDTQMAAYALKNGIIKETKAWAQLDEATKQSTRMRYAKEMMASSGATGQAAKEADAYANVQANLNEQIRQFKAMIGEPIMERLILPGMQKISSMMPDITLKVKGAVERILNFGATWKTSIWPVIQQKAEATLGIKLPDWETFKSDLAKKWEDVKTSVSGFLKLEPGVEAPDWNAIKNEIETGWNENVWSKIQTVTKVFIGVDLKDWDGSMAEALDSAQAFGADAIKAFQGILDWATGDGKGLLSFIASIAIGFKIMTSPLFALTALTALLVFNWNHVKTAVDDAFHTVVNWMTNNVGIPVENFRINVIEPLAAYWNTNVKGAIYNAIQAVGDFFGIDLAEGWDSITKSIADAWNSVTGAIAAASAAVDSFLGNSGSNAPWYVKENPDKYKGSSGIKWNAEGAVFSKPTIFNTRAGLQGVAESGPEAVAPIGVLQKYVFDAVSSQNAVMVSVLNSMLNALNQINANTAAGNKVVLDSGVLVGQLAPALDTQLGTISTRKGRRN